MKINCILENLKEAVLIAERNTSKSQSLPVLGSIFIGAENNKITLRATNLETALEIFIPGKVQESGTVVVPAKAFGSFLSNISGDQIFLQNQKDNLFVKTSQTQTVLRGYPKDDFPLFPKIEKTHVFSMSAPELLESLGSVSAAASLSDIKPELASVCFKIFKNTMKIAATDSFRLAEKTIVSKNLKEDKMTTFLVPQRSVNEIARIFGKESMLEIALNKNQLVISTNDVKFISRLTEGKFPDYEQIVPKNFTTEAVVKKQELVHFLKLASVFVGRLNDITLYFDISKKTLSLRSSNADLGEHMSEINSTIQGEEVEIKFNWRYLLDGVSNINAESLQFSLSGSQAPMLLKGKGDATFYYILMPMRGI
ncbi:DNA polymerase III subunit beta [Candidatus Giovannonibacteria bacterium]|nr:DNA polymerase III subunit beta [Candidatus Giovannonibacteria bacterium]